MINTRFEAYKIRRELKRSGHTYTFTRSELNKFKEPIGPESKVGVLNGIYHEQNSYVKVTTGDAAQTRVKKVPMILCLYEDVEALNLKMNDLVKINGKPFKVTGVVNIQEWSIISDISLEVIDNVVQI